MLVVHRGEGLHALTPMFAHGSAECEPQNFSLRHLFRIVSGHYERSYEPA
jgi:hypothetical protein